MLETRKGRPYIKDRMRPWKAAAAFLDHVQDGGPLVCHLLRRGGSVVSVTNCIFTIIQAFMSSWAEHLGQALRERRAAFNPDGGFGQDLQNPKSRNPTNYLVCPRSSGWKSAPINRSTDLPFILCLTFP